MKVQGSGFGGLGLGQGLGIRDQLGGAEFAEIRFRVEGSGWNPIQGPVQCEPCSGSHM